jgi:hypothetical protein
MVVDETGIYGQGFRFAFGQPWVKLAKIKEL